MAKSNAGPQAVELIDFAGIVRGWADLEPDRYALVWPDRSLSYAELVDNVERAAGWLHDQGAGPADVVAVAIDDEAEHVLISLALLWLGVRQVNLSAQETPLNRRAIVEATRATIAVADNARGSVGSLRSLEPSRWRSHSGGSETARKAASPFAADAVALYRTTSGSTGVPKIFGVPAGRFDRAAKRQRSDPKQEAILRTSTVQSDSTLIHRLTTIMAGRTGLFVDAYTPETITNLAGSYRITEIHMGPHRLTALARGNWPRRLPAETGILVGGARVPGVLREATRAITDNLWVTYATSEVGPVSIAPPDQHVEFPEGVGDPIEGVTVKIVDSDGNPVPPGEVGAAVIHRAFSPDGYLGESSTPSLSDGWFRPNDLLSREEGGPLIFHGRSDDVMMLDGIKVFPGAIEDTLAVHPDVAEAVAYSIRSRVHGDIPVAAVVFSGDAAERDTRHLITHCRNQLGVLAPRKIFVLETIPRTSTGKPLRRALPN